MGANPGHAGSGVCDTEGKGNPRRPAQVGDVSHGVRTNDSDTTDVNTRTEPLTTRVVGFSLLEWTFTGEQRKKAGMIHEVTG